jgi:hypothetical protein
MLLWILVFKVLTARRIYKSFVVKGLISHRTSPNTFLKLRILKQDIVNLTLEQNTKGQTGSRSISLLFNLGARREWVVKATPRPHYSLERPGTHCIGGWLDRRTVLEGCGQSLLHRDSIPETPSP